MRSLRRACQWAVIVLGFSVFSTVAALVVRKRTGWRAAAEAVLVFPVVTFWTAVAVLSSGNLEKARPARVRRPE